MRKLLMALVALSLMNLAGCSSVMTMQAGEGRPENVFQVKGKSYDAVWAAAVHQVNARNDLQIVQSEKDKGVVRADRAPWPLIMLNPGYNVAVFIKPAQASAAEYTVEVQSQPKAGPVAWRDYAPGVVAGMKVDLGM